MKFKERKFCGKTDKRNGVLLTYFCMILGIVPWLRSKPKHVKPNFREIVYFKTLSTVILACAIFSLRENHGGFSGNSSVQHVVSLSASASVYFINFYSMCSMHLWQNKNYNNFLIALDTVDDIIYNYIYRIGKINYKYCVQTVILKVVIPILMCITHLSYIAGLYWWFSVETFLRHLTAFRVILLRYHIEQVVYRYEVMSKIIRRNTRQYLEKKLSEEKYQSTLDDMMKCAIMLNEEMKLFNDMFGWFLVSLSITVIATILLYINNALLLYRLFFGIKWAILLGFWCCFHVNLLIMLVSASKSICEMTRSIGRTCFEATHLLKFPACEIGCNRRKIHEKQLILLASIAYLKPPALSVQGSFDLDYKWIFFVINFTTSYAVALLYYLDYNTV